MSDVNNAAGEGKHRELWSSRMAFIMVSVGAAVGFGNVWRFPALAYEYGGGAFFIPYLIALFFIGIPLTILEVMLGQIYRTGDVGVFGGINQRLRGIGVCSLFCASSVILYYIPLLVWVINSFFSSFTDFDSKYKDVSGGQAYDYFVYDVIGMETLDTDDLTPTRLVGDNVGYLALAYFLMFLCVGFGVKLTGRISFFTMGFPIMLLFIFLGRTCSLDGASDGIKEYIGRWDVDVLSSQADVWSTAVSQIFFSIGVTFGIMTAYGSHCEKDAQGVSNSIYIALANSFFSFIAGFSVFAALGNVAHREGVDVNELTTFGGPALLFGPYPNTLAQLENGEHWTRLFFVFLFLLGIDSAFGLFEAVYIVLCDTKLGDRFSQMQIAFGACVVGFVLSLPFVTDAGFIFLDVVDFYVNFILILVGFLEVFATGWWWGVEKQVQNLGWKAVFAYMVTTFGAFVFASCFWYGLDSEDHDAVGAGFAALFAFYFSGMVVVLFFVKQAVASNPNKFPNMKSAMYELCMSNVVDFKEHLEMNSGQKLPTVWAFMIKHLIEDAASSFPLSKFYEVSVIVIVFYTFLIYRSFV
eukprot:CAMPEP_0196806306 /NCGR_PEP_ID=MMETSP1362-20130617/6197_1 /TAXON_ID=163516 /ORGANISM="Leptocylindrus danicus, Strain CCMP1856" /LENGTH=580 /DNA_ID=CAMNT_0042179721 /DNA_START=36 /DNA_END=1774 /DNA_ORIENTATION=+